MEDVRSHDLVRTQGKSTSRVSPKKTPLPTEVSPTTKPPQKPITNAARRSRPLSANASAAAAFEPMKFFATSPTQPNSSAPPSTCPITDSTLSP